MIIDNKKGQFTKGLNPWNKGSKGIMKPNSGTYKPGDNKVDLNIRFWEKVEKTENCWNWIAGRNKHGYGRVNIDRKAILAHRVSYKMKYGFIPKNKFVLHSCDNPGCVNPKHPWIGSWKENAQDMAKKKRWGNQFIKNL